MYSPPSRGLDRAQAGSPGARACVWGWSEPARQVLAISAFMTAFLLGAAWLAIMPTAESTPAAAPRLEVDLNTAPAHVLSTLPHVGTALVDRVVAIRRQRPLASLADARARVPGIGPATIAQLAPHLKIDPTQAQTAPTLASTTAAKPPRTRRARTGRGPRLETALATSQDPR